MNGATLPVFFYFIGPVFDSFLEFDSLPKAEKAVKMSDKIREIVIIMACLAGAVIIFGFISNWFLISTASAITAKIKTKYLAAVLNQESAWFDQVNYLEISARIANQTESIN